MRHRLKRFLGWWNSNCYIDLFSAHCMLCQNDAVLDRKSILLWVGNFRTTDSLNKRNLSGIPRSARTPEHFQTEREFVVQALTHSGLRHASALGLSNRTVRRILHVELKFYRCRLMVVHELQECDRENRKACWDYILQNVSAHIVLLRSDEPHFISLITLINRIFYPEQHHSDIR